MKVHSSTNKAVGEKLIGERHVRNDYRLIPTAGSSFEETSLTRTLLQAGHRPLRDPLHGPLSWVAFTFAFPFTVPFQHACVNRARCGTEWRQLVSFMFMITRQ